MPDIEELSTNSEQKLHDYTGLSDVMRTRPPMVATSGVPGAGIMDGILAAATDRRLQSELTTDQLRAKVEQAELAGRLEKLDADLEEARELRTMSKVTGLLERQRLLGGAGGGEMDAAAITALQQSIEALGSRLETGVNAGVEVRLQALGEALQELRTGMQQDPVRSLIDTMNAAKELDSTLRELRPAPVAGGDGTSSVQVQVLANRHELAREDQRHRHLMEERVQSQEIAQAASAAMESAARTRIAEQALDTLGPALGTIVDRVLEWFATPSPPPPVAGGQETAPAAGAQAEPPPPPPPPPPAPRADPHLAPPLPPPTAAMRTEPCPTPGCGATLRFADGQTQVQCVVCGEQHELVYRPPLAAGGFSLARNPAIEGAPA